MLGSLIVFIAIQLIQPTHNISDEQTVSTDITKTVNVPDKLLNIFKNACYDCHSNNTRYPWYVNIQPIGWMMAKHIRDGKVELNFNEFGNYTSRRQISKLKGIVNQIKDDEMPLSSYTIIHMDAKLSPENKKLIIDWASNTEDSLSKRIESKK